MICQHFLIKGDCINVLNNFFKPNEIDLIITDPPFNIGKQYGFYKDKRKDYLEWCYNWIDLACKVLKPNGSLYIFNYPENNAYLKVYLDSIKEMKFKRWLTWHYPTNTGLSSKNYTRSQHSILFYSKGDDNVFNKKDIAEPYKNPTDKRIKKLIKNGSPGRTPYDVFQFNIVKNVSKEKTNHPCQIPISLLEIFIKASSNIGEKVLDLFGGSFSTAVASMNTRRNSFSIEIDENYVRMGVERLNKNNQIKGFNDEIKTINM